MKIPLHHTDEVQQLLEEHGHKKYRMDQLIHATYKDNIEQFDDMTTLSKDLRAFLNEHVFMYSLNLIHRDDSKDEQTTKFLFETHDGHKIESVIMRHK